MWQTIWGQAQSVRTIIRGTLCAIKIRERMKAKNEQQRQKLLHKEFKTLKSDTKTQSTYTQMANVCIKMGSKKENERKKKKYVCVCVIFI